MNNDIVGDASKPKEATLDSLANNGGQTDTMAVAGSLAIDAGNDGVAPATDQRGFGRAGRSDIGAFEFNGINLGATPTPTPTTATPTPTPVAQLLNISTRMEVLTRNNVLIGGFIVTGSEPKQVAVPRVHP